MELYHVVDGVEKEGQTSLMRGDCSGLSGNCTGLSGNCTGLRGDCSGLSGDISKQMCTLFMWKYHITVYKNGRFDVGCKTFTKIPAYKELVKKGFNKEVDLITYKGLVKVIAAIRQIKIKEAVKWKRV